MKLLIVEDEPLYANQLEMLVEQMGYTLAGSYDNAFDALDCFHREQPDFLLLDINLSGDVDGIQLAERVNKIRPTPTVFITSRHDNDTFEQVQKTDPVAYLLKPFDSLQLQRTIELAVAKMTTGDSSGTFEQSDLVVQDCLFIKVRQKLEKVHFDDILFLEADDRYSILYTTGGNKFAIRMPLGDLEKRLPSSRFARTHRSFLIQLKWMQSVDLQDMIIHIKDRHVPLSKGYRDDLLKRLEQV
jgi:DNA-binding LytR/AlgR family response regulator